jgi:hypothetical protein
MTGDHHGREPERATLLVRVMDEILGTHSSACEISLEQSIGSGSRQVCRLPADAGDGNVGEREPAGSPGVRA